MDSKPRLPSVDIFRGFAILGMVLVNYLAGIVWIPAFLKHTPDIGITLADFIAPFFIFAIGLTFKASFESRISRDGYTPAIRHFVIRYLALIGIGAVFSAGAAFAGESGVNWGVLQAIGVSGLVCLAFIRKNTWVRFALAIIILCFYQYILNAFMLQTTLHASHGGLFGALAWSVMLILATVFTDLFYKSKIKYLVFSLLLLALGIVLSPIIPISKNRVSATYVLIAVSAAAMLYCLFDLCVKKIKRLGFFAWWGANPLLLYILHQILLGFYVLPGVSGWYANAPVWLTVLQLLALIVVLTLIARYLYKRNRYIKL